MIGDLLFPKSVNMEATPEQAAEGVAIVRVLAAVLDRLVNANAHIARADPGQVTKFHAMKAPGISILQYLERIHKYASCSNECFILSLIYIDRLIQRSNFLLTELNVHRVVITSVMLAAKFFDDAYYNNAYYAKVGGVLVSEMNGLEVDFLFRINFSLHVTLEVFDKYRAELVMHSQTASFVSPNVSHSPIHASGAHHSPIHVSQQLYEQPLQHASTLQQPLYVPNMNQLHVTTTTYTSMPGHQSVTSAPSCMTAQHHDFRATSQITPSPPAEPEDLYPCDSTSDQLANHSLVAALSAANSFDNFMPVTRAHSLPAMNHGLATNSSATTTPPFYIPHNCAAQDHSFLAAALEQTQQQHQQQQYVILENQIFPLPTPTTMMSGGGGGHSRSDPTNLGAAVVHGHHHAHLYAQQLVHPLVGARMLTGVSGGGL
jgi:hypothetical protein